MKEQSHKDEMSAALRGDFARLRDRGVAVALAPPAAETVSAPEPAPAEPEPAAAEPPAPEPIAAAPPLAVAQPEHEPEPDAEADRPGGWLDRLLGR